MKLKDPVLMIFVFVAVLALYGGAANTQDDGQPTNCHVSHCHDHRFVELSLAQDLIGDGPVQHVAGDVSGKTRAVWTHR